MLTLMFYPPELTREELERVKVFAIQIEPITPRFAEFIEEIALRELHRHEAIVNQIEPPPEVSLPGINLADWDDLEIAEGLTLTTSLVSSKLDVRIAKLFDEIHRTLAQIAAHKLAARSPGRLPHRYPRFPE